MTEYKKHLIRCDYPCKDCDKRHVNCHSECADYQEAVKRKSEYQAALEKERCTYTLGKKRYEDRLRRVKNENHRR